MIVDPQYLRRMARQASSHAEDLRQEARRLRAGAGVRWQSLAADGFRGRLAALAGSADGAADRADVLAGALRREADDVEAELARLAALARAAEQLAEHAVVDLGNGLTGGAAALGAILSDGLSDLPSRAGR
ncbi:MAG: hypothetical protein ACTHOD_09700 [Motilibacteraceae bacterium]